MKKLYFSVIFIALVICTNAYALTFPLTYQDIMSDEFGLKEDAISIYNEISIKNKADTQERLKLAQNWKDLILKKIEIPNISQDQLVHLCRELMSVCMVGMYYANKYCFDRKNNELFNKYTETFLTPIAYATHLLGASQELDSKTRKEINDIIYMPLLKELATHEQQIKKQDNTNANSEVKTGIFNFEECEGGIGGAMHITLTDPKTGELYPMTAYKDTPTEICNLKKGTPVKVTYKIMENTDNNMFIKYDVIDGARRAFQEYIDVERDFF